MVLGLDLDDKCAQLSYMETDETPPAALSSVAGEDRYEVPTLLAKLTGVNQWVFGEEARRLFSEGKALQVDRLYERALKDETVVIEETEYKSTELLALFVKRMFGLCALLASWRSAQRIVICVEELGEDALKVWKKVLEFLDLDETRVELISRTEAFYEYTLHQPPELWNRDVLALDYSQGGLISRCLEVDRRTRPAVCRIGREEYRTLDVHDDAAFEAACRSMAQGRIITSVYLIGEPFREDEVRGTLHFLCMKRRVFQGRNLYSKGACYCAFDRCAENELTKAFLFLGPDKLKSNVGLSVCKGGETAYEPLADAGVNWYDVHRRYECYLGKEREIRILLTPLTGHNEHCAVIRLPGFPVRAERTLRIAIEVSMASEKLLRIRVTDLGFGELFPPSGQVVEEEIQLYEEE